MATPRKKAAAQAVQPVADVDPHEGHVLADTYHLGCGTCQVQLRKARPGDPMVAVWASPSVNEKTGEISAPGTVIPRSKVAELVANGQPLADLLR